MNEDNGYSSHQGTELTISLDEYAKRYGAYSRGALPGLPDKVKGLIAGDIRTVSLDFKGLKVISASDIGEIMAAVQDLRRQNIEPYLSNVSPRVRRLIVMAGLEGVVAVQSPEEPVPQ